MLNKEESMGDLKQIKREKKRLKQKRKRALKRAAREKDEYVRLQERFKFQDHDHDPDHVDNSNIWFSVINRYDDERVILSPREYGIYNVLIGVEVLQPPVPSARGKRVSYVDQLDLVEWFRKFHFENYIRLF